MIEGITRSFLLLIFQLGIQMPYCIAQPVHQVKWYFKSGLVTGPEATLIFKAEILPGWHLYSQFMEEGGPFPTQFSFESIGAYTLVGKVEETGEAVKFHDDNLMMDIIWYSGTVTFSQKIKLNQGAVIVRGKVEFMACNEQMCLPVDERQFNLEVAPWKKIP